MIRTKAFLLREISRLKKQKAKLVHEANTLKSINTINHDFKKSLNLVIKEIESTTVKIETLFWCANTREKQLPKIKSKKKKVKKEEIKEENKK